MNKNFIFSLVLVLLLCATTTALQAQTGRATQTTRQTLPRNPLLTGGVPGSFETYSFPTDYFPRFALKMNLLYGATTTPNLGIEFFLNRYLTLDIAGGWNPFVHADNVKFAHWMIQPTLRFWIQEPFNGHFLGLSGHFVDYNLSGVRQPYEWFGLFPRLALGGEEPRNPGPGETTYRFRGNAFGFSLQYGHQWVLSPRWSIETTLNFGWLRLNYEEWSGGWCGVYKGSAQRDWFGPTNAGITFIYIVR